MSGSHKQLNRTLIASAVATAIGAAATPLPTTSVAATLAEGFYDMVIANTPYVSIIGYVNGNDGAWSSGFTFSCLPNSFACSSNALYDDFSEQPVNGKYSGVPGDGVQGTVGIHVDASGNITGTGRFEFDTVPATAGGDFTEYGNSTGFTGSIDAAGNITLVPTGTLATVSDFSALVDKAWNIDNYNGFVGAGTDFMRNPPNSNTTYDAFSTGTATNLVGTINGAAYNGATAILVKGGSIGNDWGGFFGAQYFEAWNVSFRPVEGPGTFNIAIDVEGGQTQECAEPGGSYVTVSFDTSGLELESVTWTVDNVVVEGDASVEVFLDLGAHTVAVSATTVSGAVGSGNILVTVRDTQPPAIQAAFVDSRSGAVITQIDRPNVQQVNATFGVSDACDPDPAAVGFIGVPADDGEQIKIKGLNNTITLETSEVTLSVEAEDASGRSSDAKTTLLITD